MTHYRSAYTTLNRVTEQLELVEEANFTTTATADARIVAQAATTKVLLKRLIYEISDTFYNTLQRDFVPYVDTFTIYADDTKWFSSWTITGNSYRFYLRHFINRDLLSVDSITLDGTSIDSSNYRLDTSDGFPVDTIILDRDDVDFPTSNDFDTSLVITGTWGYHTNPDTMWGSSGDTVQDNPLSASATTLNVVDGTNFDTYSYIKIEDEYLFISSISTNALTVERGVNGTTAASHAMSTAISSYQQTPDVLKEATRHVIRAYMLRAGINPVYSGEAISELMQGDINLSIPERWGLGSVGGR